MATTQKVNLVLEGQNGNIFSLMGAFRRQALKDGWSATEVEKVLTQVGESANYDDALQVLMSNCANDGAGEED